MFVKIFKGIGRGIKKFWQGKVTISGKAVIIILLIITAFIGGRLSSPSPSSVSQPSASAPASASTSAPTAAPAPAPTAMPASAPTSKPTATPVAKAQPIVGEFKVTVYRQSDGWSVGSFKDSTVASGRGPLSRFSGYPAKWTGTFFVQSAGEYKFDSGGADLYIDGRLVTDSARLGSGTHNLTLKSSGGEKVNLIWQKID